MVTIAKNAIIEPWLQEPDSLEAWLENPLEGTEWVNEQLAEKSGMTLKHGRAQRLLSTLWADDLKFVDLAFDQFATKSPLLDVNVPIKLVGSVFYCTRKLSVVLIDAVLGGAIAKQ